MDFAAIREQNTRTANAAGFVFAPSLPLGEADTVRPRDEIVDRLAALIRLFAHVAAPPSAVPDAHISGFVERHDLRPAFTDEEWAIMSLPRDKANARHGDAIGWKLENMVPLAWALGYALEPGIDGQMTSDQGLVHEVIPMDPESFDRSSYALRPAEDIARFEDLFYCVHNAARSAQIAPPHEAGRFVPEGFDPIVNGGVIHERRHALTWMVSPGVSWDDTDLST